MFAASGVPCESGDGIAKCTIYFLVLDGHSHIELIPRRTFCCWDGSSHLAMYFPNNVRHASLV